MTAGPENHERITPAELLRRLRFAYVAVPTAAGAVEILAAAGWLARPDFVRGYVTVYRNDAGAVESADVRWTLVADGLTAGIGGRKGELALLSLAVSMVLGDLRRLVEVHDGRDRLLFLHGAAVAMKAGTLVDQARMNRNAAYHAEQIAESIAESIPADAGYVEAMQRAFYAGRASAYDDLAQVQELLAGSAGIDQPLTERRKGRSST